MGEEWKQYQPYPSYWVSTLGNVKRIYKNGREHIFKPSINHKGYGKIDSIRKPKRVQGLIHRMVAECFIPNPDNKPFVDHINETKTDNRVENLRWATNSENQQHISSIRSNNTTGYKGIAARTHKGQFVGWRVRLGLNNKRIELGTYHDIDDAIKVRNDAVKIYFGDFAPIEI